MSDIAIRILGLGKCYRIGTADVRHDTLRDQLADVVSRPFRRLAPGGLADAVTIWALRDLSLDVRRGEVLGIVGGNGAGKSTLLRILSRITDPTEGEARVRGRVGSLLEVGTGFHMDLTGRENVYLNGAILGMRRAEIDRSFDAIVDFAGVEAFLDTPVRHYSSGMYIRLGFAVAAHLEPEVLIVDEVLAVGDVHFQRRCLGRLGEVARSGRTVLFVSHNMAAIQRLCTSAILLERGRLVHAGQVGATVARYLAGVDRHGYRVAARSGQPEILEAGLEDGRGRPLARPVATEPIVCRMRYVLPQSAPGTQIGIGVLGADGVTVFTSQCGDAGVTLPAGPGEFEARVTIPAHTLLAGEFHLALCLWNSGDILDLQEPALSFPVDPGPSALYRESAERKGFVQVPCAWQVAEAGANDGHAGAPTRDGARP